MIQTRVRCRTSLHSVSQAKFRIVNLYVMSQWTYQTVAVIIEDLYDKTIRRIPCSSAGSFTLQYRWVTAETDTPKYYTYVNERYSFMIAHDK